MKHFPSFVNPEDIPSSLEEALIVIRNQTIFGLLWNQCSNNVQVDAIRSYRTMAGVLQSFVQLWNVEEYTQYFSTDMIADIVLEIQAQVTELVFHPESVFSFNDSEEDVIHIQEDESTHFEKFMKSRNNGKRRREQNG